MSLESEQTGESVSEGLEETGGPSVGSARRGTATAGRRAAAAGRTAEALGRTGREDGLGVGVDDGLDLVEPDGLELDGALALLDLLGDVDLVGALDEVHELVGVLADDDGAEVAGDVVPGDALGVLVVEDGEAGLVVVLLEALDGHADVELGLDGALLEALVVVGLGEAGPGEREMNLLNCEVELIIEHFFRHSWCVGLLWKLRPIS